MKNKFELNEKILKQIGNNFYLDEIIEIKNYKKGKKRTNYKPYTTYILKRLSYLPKKIVIEFKEEGLLKLR